MKESKYHLSENKRHKIFELTTIYYSSNLEVNSVSR